MLEKIKADAALAWCAMREGVKVVPPMGKPVAAFGFGVIGLCMFVAVSVGGLAYWKQPYSWGFGWHPEWSV